jgi:hypothetical protein
MEIEIHGLAPLKITSQLLLSLTANSERYHFINFIHVSNYYILLKLM